MVLVSEPEVLGPEEVPELEGPGPALALAVERVRAPGVVVVVSLVVEPEPSRTCTKLLLGIPEPRLDSL